MTRIELSGDDTWPKVAKEADNDWASERTPDHHFLGAVEVIRWPLDECGSDA